MVDMPRLLVDPPTLTPPGFGLLTVASERDGSDPHWQGEGIEWESGCVDRDALGLTREACIDAAVNPGDPVPEGADKLTGRPRGTGGQRHGAAFTVFAAYQCSTTGRTLERDRARADQVLTAGEGYIIDEVLETGAGDADLAPLSLQATATTPLGASVAASAEALVAYLEREAHEAFTGTGAVLHLPRHVALLALGQGVIVRNGARLETALGTWVNAGPGLTGAEPTAGAALADGLVWGYATGPMVAYRTPIFPPSADEAGTIDRSVNNRAVVVERTVAIGWECGAIAIPADLSYTLAP